MKTLVLTLLLWPAGVAAQTPIADAVAAFQAPSAVATPPKAQSSTDLDFATWTYVATAAADWSVTAVCFKVPCSDDPTPSVGLFVYGVEDQKKAIALGLVIDVAIVLAVRQWVAPEWPRAAEVILYGLSGARVVTTTLKIADLRQNTTSTRSAQED
jgi:hypothetical protein